MSKRNKVIIGVIIVVMVIIILITANFLKEKEEDFIIIGGIFPLTGAISDFGEPASLASQIAVDEINEKGGINGKKIKFVIQDDQSNVKVSVDVTNNLLTLKNINKYIHFAGATLSATAPITEGKAVVINPSIRTENLFGQYYHIINLAQSVDEEVKLLLNYIINKNNPDKIAIITQTNEFGETYKNSFLRNFSKEVYFSTHLSEERDFRTDINKIKFNKIEDIIITMNPIPTISFLQQLKEAGSNFRTYMVWLAESNVMFKEDIADGIIYSYPLFLDDNNMEKIEKFKEKGLFIHPVVLNSYDAVYIYAEVLSICNENDIECIIKEIKNIKYEGLTGGFTINKDGITERELYLKKITNGKGIYINQ